MKFNATILLLIQIKNMRQMPANCFALPVRVSCQINLVSLFGQGFQLFNQFALTANINIFGLKVMLHIHTKGALGQIPQMAHGSLHLVIFP